MTVELLCMWSWTCYFALCPCGFFFNKKLWCACHWPVVIFNLSFVLFLCCCFFIAPPTFVDVPPQYVEAREGGSITLSCTAFGNPKPVVTWLREGEQLATNKKYTVMSAQVDWMIQLMWCNLQIPGLEKQETEHVYWFGLTPSLQTCYHLCSGCG